MIYDDIKNFQKQFGYEPKIENAAKLKKPKKIIVTGMGGSHLAADILKCWLPDFNISVWRDYGLPPMSAAERKKTLLIAVSYSGNTEETISAFETARKRKVTITVTASGGKLIALAKKYRLPYVEMPKWGLQPRLAIGLMAKSILKIAGMEEEFKEISKLAGIFSAARFEKAGKNLAGKLRGFVPVIYASGRNFAIAQNWKIKFNETGKIPAFCNVFPELNHNEMTGFDSKKNTKNLSKNFRFILLKDDEDGPRVLKRMKILEKLYGRRGLKTEAVNISGKSRLLRIFSSLSLADWTSYYTAGNYGVEPEAVPMVEEFKKLIQR